MLQVGWARILCYDSADAVLDGGDHCCVGSVADPSPSHPTSGRFPRRRRPVRRFQVGTLCLRNMPTTSKISSPIGEQIQGRAALSLKLQPLGNTTPIGWAIRRFPRSFAKGLITYAAPDKGKYQVEESMQVVLPLTPGQEPKFTSDPDELNEHWVCDGSRSSSSRAARSS